MAVYASVERIQQASSETPRGQGNQLLGWFIAMNWADTITQRYAQNGEVVLSAGAIGSPQLLRWRSDRSFH